MSADKLHPSVEKFKLFINAHPDLVLEMRKSGNSLQDYYNKWVEYGEDDSVWGLGKDTKQKTETNYKGLLDQIVKYTENIDINKIQGHVKRFNKMLDTVQLMLGDFASTKNPNEDIGKQNDLFKLFRD